MGIVSNIACKTVGIAGMSAAIYDAYAAGKHHSHSGASEMTADYFEKIHAAERTSSTDSHITSAAQKKIADLRMNNPLIPVAGSIKGFIKGALGSLGDNIIPVSLASLAIGTKGFWSKFGAWGIAIWTGFKVLQEGFGVGKKTPADD